MSILSNRFDSGTGQPRSEQVQLRWLDASMPTVIS